MNRILLTSFAFVTGYCCAQNTVEVNGYLMIDSIKNGIGSDSFLVIKNGEVKKRKLNILDSTGVALGKSATVNINNGNEGTAIGKNSISTDPSSVAVGLNSAAAYSLLYDAANTTSGQNIAIGYKSRAMAWRATTAGAFSIAGSTSSTAYGFGATAIKIHGVAIGRGAYMPNVPDSIYGSGSAIVIGTSGTTDFGIGNWWGHKFKTPESTISIANIIPNLTTLNYHGQDAWFQDSTGGNVDGGNVAIAAGRGIGTGLGGEAQIKVSPVKNWGGNIKNPYIIPARWFGTGNYVAQKGGTPTDLPSSIATWNSTTQGVLPPRMTTAQKNAIQNPEKGLMLYDLTLDQMSYFNGTTWVNY